MRLRNGLFKLDESDDHQAWHNRSILGATSDKVSMAKEFLKGIKNHFVKNDKTETSMHLLNLISIKYKGKRIISDFIMEMSNLAFKLKALKLEPTCAFSFIISFGIIQSVQNKL